MIYDMTIWGYLFNTIQLIDLVYNMFTVWLMLYVLFNERISNRVYLNYFHQTILFKNCRIKFIFHIRSNRTMGKIHCIYSVHFLLQVTHLIINLLSIKHQFNELGKCIGSSSDICPSLFQRWGVPFEYKEVFCLIMVSPQMPRQKSLRVFIGSKMLTFIILKMYASFSTSRFDRPSLKIYEILSSVEHLTKGSLGHQDYSTFGQYQLLMQSEDEGVSSVVLVWNT